MGLKINFMKQVVILFALLFVFGCKSKTEKQMDLYSTKIKAILTDEAFKHNDNIEIIKFELLKLDTLNEAVLDTLAMKANINKMVVQADIVEKLASEVKREKKLMMLADGVSSSLYLISFNDFKEKFAEYSKQVDILAKLSGIDSAYMLQMRNKPKKGFIYEAQVFLKAQYQNQKTLKKENELDTFYYYFDKNNNRIVLP